MDRRLNQNLPDFSVYEDTNKKKSAFFSFLLPLVEIENAKLKKQRNKLLKIKTHFNTHQSLPPAYKRQLAIWGARYLPDDAIDEPDTAKNIAILELRINGVPPSLVLAQAANESAWGTSRFAKEANNLFGEWCFEPGCGIVPANRNANARHEVRKFAGVYSSISAYFYNINTHRAYKQLRETRLNLENAGKPVTGYALAGGLKNYSEKGALYIKELRQMIISNELEKTNTL